ncbi:MAG: GspH/FimT family pseudopilin [Pseudomonadota bacterium]
MSHEATLSIHAHPACVRRQHGLTLLELMIVLIMVSILAALAGPSFTGSINRSQVNGMRDGLASAFQFARSEALKRKGPVTACSSADQATCSGNWQNGWIIFSDVDGDGALDGGEQILQVKYGEDGLNAYASAANAVTFSSIGRAVAGDGSYGFCHPHQNTVGKSLTVTVTGALNRSKEVLTGC